MRHALLGEALGEEVADLGILDRNDPVEHFDHRHLAAHVVVEAGELDPDRARSDDQQLGRHFRRGHRVAVGPDLLAVACGEGQLAGPGAGGDDDVLGGELGLLAVGSHGHLAGRGDGALAHVHRDLVLLHQVRDALVQLLGDRAAAGDDLGEVGLHLARDQPEAVGMAHMVQHLARAEQRLGRDAAPVEADPAQNLPLDDRGLEAQLRCADRGDIAAGPGAEDDEVVGVSHCFPLWPRSPAACRWHRARRR